MASCRLGNSQVGASQSSPTSEQGLGHREPEDSLSVEMTLLGRVTLSFIQEVATGTSPGGILGRHGSLSWWGDGHKTRQQ